MKTALLSVVTLAFYLIGRIVRRRIRAQPDVTRCVPAGVAERPVTPAPVPDAARGVPVGHPPRPVGTPDLTTGGATAIAPPRHDVVAFAARWAVHMVGPPAACGARAHDRSRVSRRAAGRVLPTPDRYVLVDRITRHDRQTSLRAGPLRRLAAWRPAAAANELLTDEPVASALSVHVSDPDGTVVELIVPQKKRYCAMIECEKMTIEVHRPKYGGDVSVTVADADRTEVIPVGVVAHDYHHRSQPCPGIELDLRPARQAAARRPTLWRQVGWWAVVVVLVALAVLMSAYASVWADLAQVQGYFLALLIAWVEIGRAMGRDGCGHDRSRRPTTGVRRASRRGEEAEPGEGGQ